MPMLPGTGAELLFILKGAMYTSRNKRLETLPQVALLYPHNETVPLITGTNIDLISVRIRSGMLHHFIPTGMTASLPSFVDAHELWPNHIAPLLEGLYAHDNRLHKAFNIQETMRQLLREYSLNSANSAALANMLYYNHHNLTVQSSADKMGYSRRQLSRISQNCFGMSTKQYLSLVRFNRVMRNALLREEQGYLPLALDAGYFDQSHFIHDCHNYLNESPGQFFTAVSGMSHFYNTSLRL